MIAGGKNPGDAGMWRVVPETPADVAKLDADSKVNKEREAERAKAAEVARRERASDQIIEQQRIAKERAPFQSALTGAANAKSPAEFLVHAPTLAENIKKLSSLEVRALQRRINSAVKDNGPKTAEQARAMIVLSERLEDIIGSDAKIFTAEEMKAMHGKMLRERENNNTKPKGADVILQPRSFKQNVADVWKKMFG